MGAVWQPNGTEMRLGAELGRGGEGAVFELPTKPKLVAKLYHRPLDKDKQEKLKVMVAGASEALAGVAAWPVSLLTQKNGAVNGFEMPKVAGMEAIHNLYGPAQRKQKYPDKAWNFLVFAARNMAAAFQTIHEAGHVIGDVNQGNVVVGKDSRVALIDCDSFQITYRGKTFLCEVGVGHFVPPELQGLNSFAGVVRTANHDNFGLAVLVFHLLFLSRHPFSGVRTTKGESSLEDSIKAYAFAYGSDAAKRGIKPPPKSPPLDIVPPEIQAMFQRTFTEIGTTQGRPTAAEWVAALQRLFEGLKPCKQQPNIHRYSSHRGNCPWCELEAEGYYPFVDFSQGSAAPGLPSNFNINQFMAQLAAIGDVPPVPSIDASAYNAPPLPLPPEVAKNRRLSAGARLFFAFIVGGAFLAYPVYWIAWAFAYFVIWTASKPNLKALRDAFNLQAKAAEGEWGLALGARKNQSLEEQFRKKRADIVRHKDLYVALPQQESKELSELVSSQERRQRQAYLDRFFIADAKIDGVGLGRKAVLASNAIETAADVSPARIRSISGFGDALTSAIVAWQKSVERNFRFNPSLGVTEADRQAVRNQYQRKRAAAEQVLSSEIRALQALRRQTLDRRKELKARIDMAGENFARMQATLKLLS